MAGRGSIDRSVYDGLIVSHTLTNEPHRLQSGLASLLQTIGGGIWGGGGKSN